MKLKLFRKRQPSAQEERDRGYKDAAALLLRNDDQGVIEGIANAYGHYARGAADALFDYRKRRLEVAEECLTFFQEKL